MEKNGIHFQWQPGFLRDLWSLNVEFPKISCGLSRRRLAGHSFVHCSVAINGELILFGIRKMPPAELSHWVNGVFQPSRGPLPESSPFPSRPTPQLFPLHSQSDWIRS